MIKQIKNKDTKEDIKEEKADKNIVSLPALITVRELAEKLGLSVSEVITVLIKNGVSAAINETIDYETAAVTALELGVKTKQEKSKKEIRTLDIKKLIASENKKNLAPRPAVVTVMGHVDHGKTLLLDSIRQSNVLASESGGITQHIGAYQVVLPVLSADRQAGSQGKDGKKITFLDTPGHEAFVAMRSRGVSVTDIVVLVVAADDKVQPQTVESIKHAQSASLPIIVAINKIDKKEANLEKIKKELSDQGLVPEDWGGKTICIPVSAKTKEGIPDLLEMILLVAEMEGLKANPKARAKGTVLESHIDKGKGSMATVLILNGILRLMDNFVIGGCFGKIRTMENFLGEKVNEVKPSTPVVISGFSGLPQVGDILEVVGDEQEAKAKATEVLKLQHVKRITPSLEKQVTKEKKYELKIVLKVDVSGSLEALEAGLKKIGTKEVGIKIIYKGVGDITESDVLMASGGEEILGFRVKITPAARKVAKQTRVNISLCKVIYELIEDVKDKMAKLLPPEIKEVSLGKVQVLQIFKKDKSETILGGKVLKGKVEKNARVKIFRDDQEIGKGVILNLKKIDKNIKEAKTGEECGVNFRGDITLQEQDIIEVIKEEVLKKTL
jgi:translation initiation factor IF-2